MNDWQVQLQWEQWFKDHIPISAAFTAQQQQDKQKRSHQQQQRQLWNQWYQSSFRPSFDWMKQALSSTTSSCINTCIPICAQPQHSHQSSSTSSATSVLSSVSPTVVVVPMCMIWNTELEYSMIHYSMGHQLLQFNRMEDEKIYTISFTPPPLPPLPPPPSNHYNSDNQSIRVRCVLRMIRYQVIPYQTIDYDACARVNQHHRFIIPHSTKSHSTVQHHVMPVLWSIFPSELSKCYMGRRSMMPNHFIQFNPSPLVPRPLFFMPLIQHMTSYCQLYITIKVSLYHVTAPNSRMIDEQQEDSGSHHPSTVHLLEEYHVPCLVSTVRPNTVLPHREAHVVDDIVFDESMIHQQRTHDTERNIALISLISSPTSDDTANQQSLSRGVKVNEQGIGYLGHDFIRHFGCLFYQGRPLILPNHLSMSPQVVIQTEQFTSSDHFSRVVDEQYNQNVSKTVDQLHWRNPIEKTCQSFSLYYHLGNGVSFSDYFMDEGNENQQHTSTLTLQFHKQMRWRNFIFSVHSIESNGDQQLLSNGDSVLQLQNRVLLSVCLDYKSKFSVLYLSSPQFDRLAINETDAQIIDHTHCSLVSIHTALGLSFSNVTFVVTRGQFPLAVISLSHVLRQMRVKYSSLTSISSLFVVVEFGVHRQVHKVPCRIKPEQHEQVQPTIFISPFMADLFNVKDDSYLYVANPSSAVGPASKNLMFKSYCVSINQDTNEHFLILRS